MQVVHREPSDHRLADLLVAGGDARISPDRESRRNRYGCTTEPDPNVLAFGSSTASTISPQAYGAAHELAARIGGADADPAIVRREFDRIRGELRGRLGLGLLNPDIIFAASGTDAHLLAAALLAAMEASRPLTIVLAGAAESGSGVPAALGLRHFSTVSASDAAVEPGSPLGGAELPEVLDVPLRDEHGRLRAADAVDAEVEVLVGKALAAGRRVLLVMVDVSKTGLIAPTAACAQRLKQAMPDRVQVLVDACQLRLSGPSLRAYLQDEFLIACTGSKFVGGPSFSGALLVPSAAAARLRACRITADAGLYSAGPEWPQGWDAADRLPHRANLGLLLRWEGAMAELRPFDRLAPAAVADVFRRFAEAIRARLRSDPIFDLLEAPPLTRLSGDDGGGWDRVTTIFPFALRHSAPRTFRSAFSAEEVSKVHGLLRTALPGDLADHELSGVSVEFGQPVAYARRDGAALTALRVCSSAPLAVRALSGDGGVEAVIGEAMLALDKTALIARAISRDRL